MPIKAAYIYVMYNGDSYFIFRLPNHQMERLIRKLGPALETGADWKKNEEPEPENESAPARADDSAYYKSEASGTY